MSFLATIPREVGTVAIGGINLSNVQRVIYQSQSPKKGLNGVAIVSAIFAAEDVKGAASTFSKLVASNPPFVTESSASRPSDAVGIQKEVPAIVTKVVKGHPLCHNMINFVVANFAANVALAMYVLPIVPVHMWDYVLTIISLCSGASPIMSGYGLEAADLAVNGGSLLINMGTMNGQSIPNYLEAMKAYNALGNPVVLDPVGAASTEVRKNAVKELMTGGYFDVIKGNEGELKHIWGKVTSRQQGVDSGPSTLNNRKKAMMVRDLAQKEREFIYIFPPFLCSLSYNLINTPFCRLRRPINRRSRLPQRRHPHFSSWKRPSLSRGDHRGKSHPSHPPITNPPNINPRLAAHSEQPSPHSSPSTAQISSSPSSQASLSLKSPRRMQLVGSTYVDRGALFLRF